MPKNESEKSSKNVTHQNDEWIQKSVEFWSSYYNEKLSTVDVIEISHNLFGFFSLLKKWDDDSKQQTGNADK